jgi:peptide-methionine (S)-S-oxide reductase
MTTSTEHAVLAGGCFWGMQELFRRHPGVVSTRVGHAGGDVPNATYRNHGNHAESIEIIFDPDRISYRRSLNFSSRFMIRPRETGKGTTSERGIGQRSSTPPTNRSGSPMTQSPMSMIRDYGRVKGK